MDAYCCGFYAFVTPDVVSRRASLRGFGALELTEAAATWCQERAMITAHPASDSVFCGQTSRRTRHFLKGYQSPSGKNPNRDAVLEATSEAMTSPMHQRYRMAYNWLPRLRQAFGAGNRKQPRLDPIRFGIEGPRRLWALEFGACRAQGAQAAASGIPIRPIVVPFWGSYLES